MVATTFGVRPARPLAVRHALSSSLSDDSLRLAVAPPGHRLGARSVRGALESSDAHEATAGASSREPSASRRVIFSMGDDRCRTKSGCPCRRPRPGEPEITTGHR
jgi:hypothetical protein